jgi:hypothetical protein
MEALYLFIGLVITLTIGFAILLTGSTREDVMAHWGERRCGLDVLMTAYMYKPDTYTRSPMEFSSENFNFCIGAMTTDYLNTLFAKLFETLKLQMGAADLLGSVMTTLRSSLADVFKPFSTMMAKFWNKFKQIGSLSSRVFQQLYMAMKKASAIAVASLYSAISLQAALMNGLDLVVKIIMIVLYIMIALAIIFFLPLLPVMVFVFMATAGIELGFPGRTGGMGAVFCFAPDTKILTAGYGELFIKNLRLGQVLANGSTVEAVIEVPGFHETIYDLYGVKVSGGHRVWSALYKDFISVEDHHDAIATNEKIPTLWTLITSNREIPVKGNRGHSHDGSYIRFADWEELPKTAATSAAWDRIVRDMLNCSDSAATIPLNPPCLDMSIRVKKYQCGIVPLISIKRGDWIEDTNGWTRVIGICMREVTGGIGEKGCRMTDGNWIQDSKGKWNHPTGESDSWKWQGMQLITESGTFHIFLSNEPVLVRDFTEVGCMKLKESYAREDSI